MVFHRPIEVILAAFKDQTGLEDSVYRSAISSGDVTQRHHPRHHPNSIESLQVPFTG